MSTTRGAERAAWIVVALLWFVAMLNYLDRQLIVTMGQPIKADLDIGDAYFGLFSSVFLWVYAFCSLFAGFVADRFGRRRAILLSLAVWSMATFCTGFAQDFATMLLARAVMGISEAFYVPAAVAMIVEYHRGRTRSLATGLHISGMYFGSILGGLGGWMADSFGWRLGFQLFGAVGVGYALFLTAMLKNPPPAGDDEAPSKISAKPEFVKTLRTLLGSRGFRRLLGVSACVGAGFWTVKNWMPTFFNMELGVDLTRAGLYGAAVFNAAAFVGIVDRGNTVGSLGSAKPSRSHTHSRSRILHCRSVSVRSRHYADGSGRLCVDRHPWNGTGLARHESDACRLHRGRISISRHWLWVAELCRHLGRRSDDVCRRLVEGCRDFFRDDISVHRRIHFIGRPIAVRCKTKIW